MAEKIIITEKQVQKIKNQIDNSFCKIEINKEENIIGFFCYIPIQNEINLLPVLIVNNFIKKDSDKITIYKNNNCLSLSIDKKRKIFSIEEYNITIIEIKENDNLNMNSFLDIDEDIYEEDLKESFAQKAIYLLYYSKSKDIKYALGVIKDIDEDDYKFEYFCDTENDSPSMGLILNLSNFKIIGFHLGAIKGENLNSGIFINAQIDNFNKNLQKLNDNYQGSNEITIIYKNIKLKRKYLREDSEIKLTKNKIILFGEKFVEKNKKICKILIEGKEKELISLYSNERLRENEKLEIKLKGIKDIVDMSYMFYRCFSLFSIPDISEWNTSNVTNMSHAFDGCISLTDLPDISKLNTYNVSDMSYMFKDCESLQILPDITKWRMDCANNVSCIFFKSNRCENIKENIEKIKRENMPIKMTEKDIPQIQEIFIFYWGTKSLEDYMEFKRIINYNLSYAYKVNDNLIGFCLMENKSEEDSIYVDLLCIRKEYSGNHFGESLLKYCIDNCQKMKYENFSLHVTTKNTPALNLYKKLGFEIKEFIKEYYEDQEPGNNDAYFMTLNTSKK